MAFTRESLNTAVSAKLADCNSASIYHQSLFGVTQIAGIAGMAGALLIAPLALEVSVITGIAGLSFYGISQLMQTKRTGHFLPLPAVPVSAAQLWYVPARLIAQLMASAQPEAPEDVRLLPGDWLPQRERRINYLLTHCPDILIATAENAQDGISFAAIVDTAVRASEMVISDRQIQSPVIANKLRGDVRALLSGDTSKLEAQQSQAIAAEWQRAQADHESGYIDEGELKAIEAEVTAIAPDVVKTTSVITTPQTVDAAISPAADSSDSDEIRTDWQAVFALIKDQDTYPAIAVIGSQGKGKTTLVDYLLSLLNHDKIVLDPHYAAGAWPGCRVIGAGMNYAAVGEALENISADVKERYLQRASDVNYVPQRVTLVLEEQTNWVAKVDGAGTFLKETLSDIRKVGYQSISVAHGTTNTARGGAKGTAKMRSQGELKIELVERGLAKISLKDSETFMLRYPDPKPSTVTAGAPVVLPDGNLGPGYIGADYVDPQPWHKGADQNTPLTAHRDYCLGDASTSRSLALLVKSEHDAAVVFGEAYSWLTEREGDDPLPYNTVKNAGWTRKLRSRSKDTIAEFLDAVTYVNAISIDDDGTIYFA